MDSTDRRAKRRERTCDVVAQNRADFVVGEHVRPLAVFGYPLASPAKRLPIVPVEPP